MADRVENNIVNSLNKAFNGVKFADNNDKMLALSSMKNSIVDSELEEGDEVFIDMKKKVESKEATGAASAGSYVGPAFMSTDVEDTETKTKTKPQGGEVGEEKIPGGLSKGKTLMDIAKIHAKDKKTKVQSPERIEKMFNHLEKQLQKGIKVEMEHTSSKKVAKEIALDHLFEDPNYYNKLSKIEATEATTTASSGQYSQPAFLAKNAKNWRASKKTQIPGGKFVEVKKKCSTYPYCNQGDINSVKMWESKMVQDALSNVSKNTGLSQDYIKSLVESQLNKKDYRKIVKEDEPEFVTLDRGEPSKETSFEDLIQDKKAKFLIDKFQGKEFQFNNGKLSGKFEILSIGPADKYIGFASSLENYNFENGEDVQIIIDLKELNFKGEKVPVGFYDMISRYLPEEDEEDSYRGDPVESAVMSGLDDLDETLKYLSLYLAKVRINPYSHLRR